MTSCFCLKVISVTRKSLVENTILQIDHYCMLDIFSWKIIVSLVNDTIIQYIVSDSIAIFLSLEYNGINHFQYHKIEQDRDLSISDVYKIPHCSN